MPNEPWNDWIRKPLKTKIMLKKLTKEQKLAGYKSVLFELERYFPAYYRSNPHSPAPYICDMLREYYNTHSEKSSYDREIILKEIFPEFLQCKPTRKEDNDQWWGETDIDILMRVVALEWCIETVKNS
jgi:hypothetical protein